MASLPYESIYKSMKNFVCDLAYRTSSDDLGRLFAQASEVESASVISGRDTGPSRGFGFVEMSSRREGAPAMAQFKGKEVGGRALTVNEARPSANRATDAGITSINGLGGYSGNARRDGKNGDSHRRSFTERSRPNRFTGHFSLDRRLSFEQFEKTC